VPECFVETSANAFSAASSLACCVGKLRGVGEFLLTRGVLPLAVEVEGGGQEDHNQRRRAEANDLPPVLADVLHRMADLLRKPVGLQVFSRECCH
jgi:hypothetical protein